MPMPLLQLHHVRAQLGLWHVGKFFMDKSIYAALTAAAAMGPPSLEGCRKRRFDGSVSNRMGGVGGIFLAGLILGAFITYLVVEKVGLSRADGDVENSGDSH
jgi:hypothetical protein